MVAVGIVQSQINMRRTPLRVEIIQAVSYSTAISTIEVLPAVTEQEAWLLLAQSVFAKGWDNPQDARYDAL